MRKDGGHKGDGTRRGRMVMLLGSVATLTGAGLLSWMVYGAASISAGPPLQASETVVSGADAREMVGSYSSSIGGAPLVLARLGEWPARKYPGLAVSVERRPSQAGRVSYDVVALVGSREICQGAIAGGREDATILRIGDVILPPPAVRPYRNGKATIEPSSYLCEGRRYPLLLRFSHEVALPEAVSAGNR